MSGNSYPFPFVGPIAPETNPRIEPLWYLPSNFTISAISRGVNTTVTTTSSVSAPSTNNYVVGQLVKFNIPSTYGIQQLNGQQGYVIETIPPNQFVVNINSTKYNDFIPSPSYGPTPPQVAAIGDINSGALNSIPIRTNGSPTNMTLYQQPFIPGSFIDVSPERQT